MNTIGIIDAANQFHKVPIFKKLYNKYVVIFDGLGFEVPIEACTCRYLKDFDHRHIKEYSIDDPNDPWDWPTQKYADQC